ncbi:MAG: GNAT family N-acetyltransferase [Thalassospira sp.]|nr:GNAT family N-acetyltransferase [Thalassospira xiamenensis]MBC07747.1 GNAT family N-acetyltransferase [Thalassospira sp.]
MLADPSTTIFVARANEEIVGMTTLVIFRVATGLRAFIDDVVVMTTHQKRRLGERLVRAAINHATSHGIEKIDLTSRPSRETANRLYQRMGFERRETNVYRLKLKAGVVSPEP